MGRCVQGMRGDIYSNPGYDMAQHSAGCGTP